MAISVKDIQEKEFTTQAHNGYNVEEVDDFLDALAEQLGSMIRDSLALNGKVRQLEQALAASKAETEDAKKRLPDYDEEGYFRNLEKSIREALIGAQRIADETVANAKAQAEKIVSDAKAQAEKTTSEADTIAKQAIDEAEKRVDELSAEAEKLQSAIESYRTNFKRVMEQQLAALTEGDKLLK